MYLKGEIKVKDSSLSLEILHKQKKQSVYKNVLLSTVEERSGILQICLSFLNVEGLGLCAI